MHSSSRTLTALQSALLVAPRSLPGIEVGSAYESETEFARVGGDFLDVFPLGATLVAFMVGDVAGKGLEAAAFAAEARATTRTLAMQTGAPTAALDLANRALAPWLEEGRFVTLILGTLDVATGDVVLSCAGHPEPAFITAAGYEFREIERNPPLGVVDDVRFAEYRTTIEPGDRLVLFSDGLLDARHGPELFGQEGVLAVLHSARGQEPTSVARILLDAARGFSGGRLKDDIAIVVLDYAGPPSTPLI